MAYGLTDSQNYENIADAIRSQSNGVGAEDTFLPSEMPDAIRAFRALWGGVAGDISEQEDLAELLALKSNASGDRHHTYYVKGTQTAVTGAWTGNLPDVDALYEGLSIDYWLPFAGSGNATLNLTLKDGSVTGPIPVYYGGTAAVTATQPVNTILRYIYQTITISNVSYTGWWAIRTYYQNTTDIVNLYEGESAYQANSVVYRYQLLFQMADRSKLTPLNNNSNKTGTNKTMLTNVEFDPFGKIYFHYSTETVNAGENLTTTLYYHRSTFDLRYTFNCGSTLVPHKDLYLQVILQSNGMVKLASAMPLVQDLPATNDGCLYIFLGRAASNYKGVLYTDHPVFYHNGREIVELTHPLKNDYAVQVSGTTPVITAVAGTRYICGECATLDITLPESGIVDVIFSSGSTPTVLTVTPPSGVTLKWANGFDPTDLDADTVYEINVMDGLGVAVSWT